MYWGYRKGNCISNINISSKEAWCSKKERSSHQINQLILLEQWSDGVVNAINLKLAGKCKLAKHSAIKSRQIHKEATEFSHLLFCYFLVTNVCVCICISVYLYTHIHTYTYIDLMRSHSAERRLEILSSVSPNIRFPTQPGNMSVPPFSLDLRLMVLWMLSILLSSVAFYLKKIVD